MTKEEAVKENLERFEKSLRTANPYSLLSTVVGAYISCDDLAVAIDSIECVQSSAFKDGYRKGRQDAIDAISDLVRNSIGWNSYEDMLADFEQVKEQKNE